MVKLSIVIPAYNEEKSIEKTLLNYCAFFIKHAIDFEFIVSIDKSLDNTEAVVKKLAKENKRIKYIVHPYRRGKGGALIDGFKLAKGDIIGFIDADGSTSPQTFYELLKNLDGVDGVIASRWIRGSKRINMSFFRAILSKGFNWGIRVLFFIPYKDTQCGAKVFTRKVVEAVVNNLRTTNFAFDVNLLNEIHKHGFKLKEVPIVWVAEEKKSSVVPWAVIPKMIITAIRIKFNI